MKRKIADLMTRVVEVVTPQMTVQDVAAKMKDQDVGFFPVCADGVVVGVVTDRDLALRVLAEGRDPSTTRIDAVMTRELVCCNADNRLAEAVVAMTERKIRRLPIVSSEGHLVGLLTLGKLAAVDPAAASTLLKGLVQATVKDAV